jgi:hypothetical protein
MLTPANRFAEMIFRSAVSLTPSPLVPTRLAWPLPKYRDAVFQVALGHGPGRIRADVIALDHVIVADHDDAGSGEAINDQSLHRAAVAGDIEPRDAVGPGQAAVQLDQRRAGIARLRSAVEKQRPGDGRQARERLNSVHAHTGNVEVDGV